MGAKGWHVSEETLPSRLREDGQSPPRGPLSLVVASAATMLHRTAWGTPYRSGEGPMHHAGGPYWHGELLRKAAEWERLARAARICAEVLPDE